MKASRPLKRVFLAAGVLVVASMVVIYWVGELASGAEEATKGELEDLEALSTFRLTLLNAETGQRGYVLTGEETYLSPYNIAISQIPRELDWLNVLAKNGKLPTAKVAQLNQLTQEKLQEMAKTIVSRQQSGMQAALPLIKSGQGSEIMDELRAVLDEMTGAVESRLDVSVNYATGMMRMRTATSAAVTVLGLVFVWWAYRRLSAEMTRSETAAAEAIGKKAELEEMVTELRHISYAITHDMRAPLRAMSAFATLLMEEVKDASANAKDYCRRIIAGSARLDKLIQDALHYTKAILQDIPTGPVDLDQLVHELLQTYPNLQKDKADVLIEDDLPVVIGNEALLTQCFSNLLGNAVKFVAPGVRPKIHVWAQTKADMTRIWVEDNGIGIPAGAQTRLFKMFERLTHNHEGSGMGLAVVRKLVERMGGRVGVESQEGKGSRFWMELRISKP